MILSFVLLGHWLGLGWFALAIEPLKASSEDGTLDAEPPYPWIWTNEDATGNEYICSLYWALSVMTNLKGLPVHESRQCFWEDPFSLEPAKERIYTICAFLMGAIFFSVIYGNINQAVTNFYSSGLRYRKRMAEIDEFVRFHKLSKDVRKKVRNFVDFAFSVTKGLNIDTISSQLPAHLQLEIYMQMNKKMVEQVTIFAGCPREFFQAIVMKLGSTICCEGDYVFHHGERGARMFFLKRGVAEVLNKEDKVVHTFKEGDYFGEIALLCDQPRTASVRAVTDCMLLGLSAHELESVLNLFPVARERIEHAAQLRIENLSGHGRQKLTIRKSKWEQLRRRSVSNLLGAKTQKESVTGTRYGPDEKRNTPRANSPSVLQGGRKVGPAPPAHRERRMSIEGSMAELKAQNAAPVIRGMPPMGSTADPKAAPPMEPPQLCPSAKKSFRLGGVSSSGLAASDGIHEEAAKAIKRTLSCGNFVGGSQNDDDDDDVGDEDATLVSDGKCGLLDFGSTALPASRSYSQLSLLAQQEQSEGKHHKSEEALPRASSRTSTLALAEREEGRMSSCRSEPPDDDYYDGGDSSAHSASAQPVFASSSCPAEKKQGCRCGSRIGTPLMRGATTTSIRSGSVTAVSKQDLVKDKQGTRRNSLTAIIRSSSRGETQEREQDRGSGARKTRVAFNSSKPGSNSAAVAVASVSADLVEAAVERVRKEFSALLDEQMQGLHRALREEVRQLAARQEHIYTAVSEGTNMLSQLGSRVTDKWTS